MSNDRQPSRSTPDLSSQCRSPSPKHFRARPVPRNLFSNYVYKKKQEDEFFRALKRKVRGEGMLRAASLPPSMEFRERLGRVRAEAEAAEAAASSTASGGSEWRGERRGAAADGDLGDSSGGPGPTGPGRPAGSRPGGARRGHTHPRRPPDFSKCHDKMRQELYERQTRNITTSPSPYSLRTSSLSPRRKCLQGSAGSASSGSDSRRCRTRPRPRSSGSSPCVDAAGGDSGASRSNLAAVLRVQTARQRLEAEHHRLREEQLRRAEVRLKERLRRLTPAWRSIQYSTEEDLALRAAARRQEERQRRREHGVLMRHMLHRVHTIPTLFERQSASSWSPRSPCALEQCGPACPALVDLDDEDASDVKVFVRRAEEGEDEDDERVEDLRQGKRQGQRQSRPRQRQRPDRPCSAGLGGPGGSGGRRSRGPPEAQPKLAKHLCKQTPRGRGSTPGPWPGSPGSSATSALQALRSPDRISSKLRNYHRQLPHVEFSESQGESPHSLRGRDEDDDDDDDQGGAGASRSR